MLISIVNRSHLRDADVQRAVRAINRQFAEDFAPQWQFGARLRLDGAGAMPSGLSQHVALNALPGRRGDAVIYLLDAASIADAEGYHDRNPGDIPFGFVFLDVCEKVGDEWTVALSHEAIELVGDPLNNLLVQGPHPFDRRHLVFHMFELCDAVQSETYELDGVLLSNFVLPDYFTRGDAEGVRNDFLGRKKRGDVLPSFGMAEGGYLCFYDGRRDEGERWNSVTRPDDPVALKRLSAKAPLRGGRIARRQHAGK